MAKINPALGGEGISCNQLSIKIGQHQLTLIFKTGGDLVMPEAYQAQAGRGVSGTGLFDESTVSGDIVCSRTAYQTLLAAFQDNKFLHQGTATHVSYLSYDGGITITTTFNACVVSKLPVVAIANQGADVVMNVAFSLNDILEQKTE